MDGEGIVRTVRHEIAERRRLSVPDDDELVTEERLAGVLEALVDEVLMEVFNRIDEMRLR